MSRVTVSQQARAIVQTQSVIGELKAALDQASAGGKVITVDEAQRVLAQTQGMPDATLQDLKASMLDALTAPDHWRCDAGARSALAQFVGVPAEGLPPAVEPPAEQTAALQAQRAAELRATLDNLDQLAPQRDSAAQRALATPDRPIPSTQYDGSQSGVLNLLSQQGTPTVPGGATMPTMATGYPPAAAALLAQQYGPQAAMQMLQLELAMVRMEMALMAAMQGASPEQIQGFLRDPSPQGQQLAAQLQSLGQMLASGDFDMEDVERQLASGRQQFIDYAGRQSGVDPSQLQTMSEQELGVQPRPGTRPPSDEGGPAAVGTRYPPFSSEAKALFREAARKAGVPESWADSPGLHNILKRESNGQVGVPNYTYGGRKKDPAQWSAIHNELKNGRITAKSSATGLGQLLLRNVDRYYPSGRAGIGDPVEEAAGMLAYIKDRYGSPERAWALYGKLHEGY
ncbi:MAG: hypothetical protein ABIJ09_16720 [Pseudomonadota bacterium]